MKRYVYPIDMRNATRTTPYDIGGIHREGLGIGDKDSPSSTLSTLFTPAIAVITSWNLPK